MRRQSLKVLGLLLAIGLVASACGSSDDSGSSTDNSSDNSTNNSTETTEAGATGAESALAALAGETIGVQSDTTGETYATENKPEGSTIKSFGDTDELFGALSSGQIKGILQDLPINGYRATQDDSVEVVETFKTDEQYGFVVKKGNAALLAAINAGLAEARTDGTYNDLYKKYFGQDSEGEGPTPTTGDATGLETIKDGTLTMCSDIPYAPMEFEAEDGEGVGGYTGFDVELMQAIAKSANLDLSIIDVDFDGIIGNLAAGKCDVVASSVTITEERKQGADFSDPYFDADQSLLVKK